MSQGEYSLTGVMRYLQTEWQRNKRDRIQWELERAEMKARIAKLEGEKRGLQLLVESHLKKIKSMEEKYGEECSSKESVLEQSKKEFEEYTNNNIDNTEQVDLTPLLESRQYLEKCIQEVEYLLQNNSNDNDSSNEDMIDSNQPIISKDIHPTRISPVSSSNNTPSNGKWRFKNQFTYPGVKCIRFNGQDQLVSSGDDGIRIWNLQDGFFRDLVHGSRNSKIEIYNNNTIFTLASDKTLWLDIETGVIKKTTDYGVDLSLIDDQLATGDKNTVQIFNVNSGETINTFTTDGDIVKLFFHTKDHILVAMVDKLSLYEIHTGNAVVSYATSTNSKVTDICYSLSNEVLIISHSDGTIGQYDPNIGALVKESKHSSSVTTVASSPSSSRNFMSGSDTDNSIKLWSFTTNETTTLSHQYVQSVAWHPSSNMIASCGNNVIQTFIK